MAKRYIGDAVVRIVYHDEGDYRGTISAGGRVWPFRDLRAPRMGGAANCYGYDSPEAYDEQAASAVSFGQHQEQGCEWAADRATAVAIGDATAWASVEDGSYEVRRSPKGQSRWVS